MAPVGRKGDGPSMDGPFSMGSVDGGGAAAGSRDADICGHLCVVRMVGGSYSPTMQAGVAQDCDCCTGLIQACPQSYEIQEQSLRAGVEYGIMEAELGLE